ncbi:MAG: hypothetical protein ACLGPL_06105 [Acidobacteriota bacterium]
MEDRARDHLRALAQLAQEYQKKYHDVEQALKDAEPTVVLRQLNGLSEMTTDRFRAAQQALLSKLALDEVDEAAGEEAYRAAVALCSCFDEMRILFQILLDHADKME